MKSLKKVLAVLLSLLLMFTAVTAATSAGAAQAEIWLSDKKYSDDGKTLKDIPYPSTKKYVEKVMRVKNIYEKLYYK